MLIAILVFVVIGCLLLLVAATCLVLSLLVLLAISAVVFRAEVALNQIAASASRLDAIQFGPCDDPSCPECNPVEEGEEWKHGRIQDD